MTACRNTHRLLALGGVVVFGLLTLVGCGGGGGGGGGSPAKAWGTAQLIETDDAGDASRPQIAVDGSGNAIAVWQQFDGTRSDIWANRFSAGAWGTAQLIETDNAGNALEAQIAVDGNGNAFAVWEQFDGMRLNIWANHFIAGAWGTAQLIEADNAGDAEIPQIAVDGSGNAIAVWYQFDGTRFNIWANRFSAGAWGTAQLIEAEDAGNATRPQIAVDGSGNAIAVWQQSDGTRNNIWANRFDAGLDAWDVAALIETDDAGSASLPQIAVDGNGNAIAVWEQFDGTRTNIWANRFSAGAWGTAQLIETDDAGAAAFPQVAVDGSGNAIAVWQQSDGTRFNIWANRFSAGAWGTAQLIEAGAASAEVPQIAVDGSGNAIAVWEQHDGTRFNIWANRFDAGAWGTAQLIETDNAGNALRPQIAVDGSGNAIAVWVQSDGTRDNIWANRFE